MHVSFYTHPVHPCVSITKRRRRRSWLSQRKDVDTCTNVHTYVLFLLLKAKSSHQTRYHDTQRHYKYEALTHALSRICTTTTSTSLSGHSAIMTIVLLLCPFALRNLYRHGGLPSSKMDENKEEEEEREVMYKRHRDNDRTKGRRTTTLPLRKKEILLSYLYLHRFIVER